jgi:hypothetical protein
LLEQFRHERHSAREFGGGFVEETLLQQHASELVMRLRIIGPQRQRTPVPFRDFLQIALRGASLLPVHHAIAVTANRII